MTRQLYPSGRHRGRTIGGRYVLITPHGVSTISPDLTRGIPPGEWWLRVEYDADERKLWFTPLDHIEDGSLKATMPGECHAGYQARVGTQSGFKTWGIRPAQSTRYVAEWNGPEIVVDLTREFHGGARDPATPSQVEGRAAAQPTLPPTPPGKERNCGNCIKQSFRLCTNQASPKRNTKVSLDDVCNEHFFATEKRSQDTAAPAASPAEPEPAAARPSRGSRPRRICAACGHEVPVCKRGFMRHDQEGRLFAGGNGNKKNECRGGVQMT